MKILFLTLILILSSTSTHAEYSICNGKFENGQPVHIKINWDKNTVNINGTDHLISGVNHTGHGIVTVDFNNALKEKTYFVIGHFNNDNFIGQYSEFKKDDKGFPIVLNWGILSCSKSFTKPFMTRMLAST